MDNIYEITMYTDNPQDFLDVLQKQVNIFPYIILLSGQARVGKTTMAKMLADNLFNMGNIPVLMSFADPIKEDLKAIGILKGDPKYRDSAVALGEAERLKNPDVFVEKALNKIKEYTDKHGLTKHVFIFDDCRFLNELKIAPEESIFTIGLIPEYQADLEEPLADYRWDQAEAMARILLKADKDSEIMGVRPINTGPHQTVEEINKTSFDMCVLLNHKENWKETATEAAKEISEIINLLRTTKPAILSDSTE